MTTRELSWLETATIILQDSTKVWMTAPEIVRETTKRDIKTINYSQSVRTLRQSLSTSSQKAGSPFVKREIKGSIFFSLRKRSEAPSSTKTGKVHNKVGRPKKPKRSQQDQNQAKRKGQDTEKTPYLMVNGLAEDEACSTSRYSPGSMIQYHAPPPFCTQSRYMALHRVPEPTTVEIDPDLLHQAASPDSPMVCLPSPQASILAPQKVLQSRPLADEHSVRRKSRKRPSREGVSESPLSPLMNGFTHEAFLPLNCTTTPDVMCMETCHTLSSPDFEVECVRPVPSDHQLKSSHDEDPCKAQGDRSHCASFELEPKPPRKKKKPLEVVKYDVEPLSSTTQPSSSSSSSSSEESDLESDFSDVRIQSRPSSQLLVRRLSQQKQQLPGSQVGGDSMSDEDGMDTMSDADQDYMTASTTNNLRRSREVMKRRRMKIKRRAAAGMAKSGKAGDQARHVESAGKDGEGLKRNISLLFQPQSPLINENLKSFLNMETFMTLSEGQKAKLVKLLPAVDRSGPTSIADTGLNNSFFGSALREWVDLVALGGFTPEHRAKLRADEKKKNAVGRQEDTWKSRFFEDNWGDKQNSESGDVSTPFFPRPKPSSDILQACLSTILKSYNKGELESPPVSPPSLPALVDSSQTTPKSSGPVESLAQNSTPPAVASSRTPPTKEQKVPGSPARQALSSPLVSKSRSPLAESKNMLRHFPNNRTKTPSSCTPPKPSPRSPASTPPQAKQKPQSPKITKKLPKPSPKTPLIQKKNHIAKRVLSKVSVQSLPLRAEEKSPKKSGKVLAVASSGRPNGTAASVRASSKIIEQLKLGTSSGKTIISKDELSSQFLSHLPPRTPYQTLLVALNKASKPNKAILYSSATSHSRNTQLSTKLISLPSPVSSQTVPHTHSVFHDHFSTLAEAHVPSEFCSPIRSLPVCIPARIYESHQCGKQIQLEHSYIHRTKGSTGRMKRQRMQFKLSVPRSILKKNDCICEKGPLVFCSCCHSLYHSLCNSRTLCQSCFALRISSK